jgi:hypothetical protein
MDKTLKCPKCEKPLDRKSTDAIITSDPATRKIYSENRVSRGYCAEHGWCDDDEKMPKQPGHHATFWTSEFEREFRNIVQDKLLPQLSADERRDFVDMREGRRRPDWDWLSGLKRLISP